MAVDGCGDIRSSQAIIVGKVIFGDIVGADAKVLPVIVAPLVADEHQRTIVGVVLVNLLCPLATDIAGGSKRTIYETIGGLNTPVNLFGNGFDKVSHLFVGELVGNCVAECCCERRSHLLYPRLMWLSIKDKVTLRVSQLISAHPKLFR